MTLFFFALAFGLFVAALIRAFLDGLGGDTSIAFVLLASMSLTAFAIANTLEIAT